MTGPIALVGSGEYLPHMQELEASLIAGRPARYVQLPTAAAPEGDQSLQRWIDLGVAQAQRMGVEAVPLMVRNRQDADSAEIAAQIAGAGLIYMSGGNPGFLAQTLEGTAVWQAIVQAWQDGAALAGCSAGAMAIADHIPALRRHGEQRPRQQCRGEEQRPGPVETDAMDRLVKHVEHTAEIGRAHV